MSTNPEPREYLPVGPMNGHQVTGYYLDGLSRDHLESMLRFLSGWTPEGFEHALRAIGRIAVPDETAGEVSS